MMAFTKIKTNQKTFLETYLRGTGKIKIFKINQSTLLGYLNSNSNQKNYAA